MNKRHLNTDSAEKPAPYQPRTGEGGPRERAARHGIGQLSDLDLVQTLLGSGGPGRPVRHLAAEVLGVLEASPGMPDRNGLLRVRGMGEAKATLICGALELARRLWLPEGRRIRLPPDTLPLLRHWADRPQEYFISLALNGANEVLSCRPVSMGLVNRTLVHPREVYAEAISLRACNIIVAHNHPSGHIDPSEDDRETTRRLRQAGEILGIGLLDHIIFSGDSYLSFAEEGLL
jgi:DNA repair protein RadC